MIKAEFFISLRNYTSDKELHQTLWKDIEIKYAASGRYYHTLVHLDSLLGKLMPHKNEFTSWDACVFAIAYHDIVYDVLKNDNEELSSAYAESVLHKIPVPEQVIALCKNFILATKKHEAAERQTSLFTDADLSIFGTDSKTYSTYANQIRLEYAIFPDEVYYQGRKKVLEHFLQSKKIYKTQEFSIQYESNARANLLNELNAMTHGKI